MRKNRWDEHARAYFFMVEETTIRTSTNCHDSEEKLTILILHRNDLQRQSQPVTRRCANADTCDLNPYTPQSSEAPRCRQRETLLEKSSLPHCQLLLFLAPLYAKHAPSWFLSSASSTLLTIFCALASTCAPLRILSLREWWCSP